MLGIMASELYSIVVEPEVNKTIFKLFKLLYFAIDKNKAVKYFAVGWLWNSMLKNWIQHEIEIFNWRVKSAVFKINQIYL